MVKNENRLNKHSHFEEGIRLIYKGLLPIVLVAGGLVLLALRLSGWSLIFGLPMMVIGVVFIIYTYDELVREKVRPIPKKEVRCSVCGKLTPRVYPWEDAEDAVCLACRKKRLKTSKKNQE
jgi:hypothetical protein